MAVYEKWPTIKYGTLTVGKDDVGHDVKFYGATSGSYFQWDESADTLILDGDISIDNGYGLLVGGTTQQVVSDGGGSSDVTPEGQFVGTTQDDSTVLIGQWNTTNASGPMVALVKSGNGTIGSHTAVADNEYVGRIVAFGDDGTDLESPVGEIRFVVNGTVGTGDMPGSIEFYTTADGGETLTKALVIEQDQKSVFSGAIDVGVDGTGYDVKFFGTTSGTYFLWDESADKAYINVEPLSGGNLAALTANMDMDVADDSTTSYYYGIQSNASKSGTDETDDFSCFTAYINQTTGDFTTTGRFAPLQVLLSGSGTVGTITKSGNGAVHAAWIANRGTQTNTDSVLCVHNQSAATASSGIELDLDGTITYAFDFGGTVSDGWSSGDGAVTQSNEYVKIPVNVDGITPTLYILAAETWS